MRRLAPDLAWKKHREDETLKSYEIVRGDTLSDIAVKHRVSAEKIKTINGLHGDTIKIGQVLKIPAS
ncbi:MAG: LysM peptidoglycan-binding domain-containing protein [Gammaproteobacteria bacterium]|nr:LysM peptidoglycan-binding domain-containing protein [Gammaproteobacteria bacterium]